MIPGSRFVELDKAIHDRRAFDCGKGEQNFFLQQFAEKHRTAGISLTMVLPTADNEGEICAYYALSHTEIKRQSLPTSVAKRLPYYPIPVILIAQLAVNLHAHGKGLGKITLIRALKHAYEINEHLPSFAVVVDALNDEVQGFYEQFGFELLDSQTQRKRLFMSMKTIEQLFE